MNAESTESWWSWVLLMVQVMEIIAVTLPAIGLLLAALLFACPRLCHVRIAFSVSPGRVGSRAATASAEPQAGPRGAATTYQESIPQPV